MTFWVATAPSGDTQAQRLATQMDDEVMAMPNAPVLAQRATTEYVKLRPAVFLS